MFGNWAAKNCVGHPVYQVTGQPTINCLLGYPVCSVTGQPTNIYLLGDPVGQVTGQPNIILDTLYVR